MQLPTEDKYTYKKQYVEAQIAILMGGRVAEELTQDDITTGAGNDIERATDMARRMVCEWGMSELGPLSYGAKDEPVFLGRDFAQRADYSEDTAHPHRPRGQPHRPDRPTSGPRSILTAEPGRARPRGRTICWSARRWTARRSTGIIREMTGHEPAPTRPVPPGEGLVVGGHEVPEAGAHPRRRPGQPLGGRDRRRAEAQTADAQPADAEVEPEVAGSQRRSARAVPERRAVGVGLHRPSPGWRPRPYPTPPAPGPSALPARTLPRSGRPSAGHGHPEPHPRFLQRRRPLDRPGRRPWSGASRLLAEGADLLDLGAESTRPGGGVYGGGARTVPPEEESGPPPPRARSPAARHGRTALGGHPQGRGGPPGPGGRRRPDQRRERPGRPRPRPGRGRGRLPAGPHAQPRRPRHHAERHPLRRPPRRGARRAGRSPGARREAWDRRVAARARSRPRLRQDGRAEPRPPRPAGRAAPPWAGPLLVGASRKSFLAHGSPGRAARRPPRGRGLGSLPGEPRRRRPGPQAPAAILRVHDVAETVQFLDVWQAIAAQSRGREGA